MPRRARLDASGVLQEYRLKAKGVEGEGVYPLPGKSNYSSIGSL